MTLTCIKNKKGEINFMRLITSTFVVLLVIVPSAYADCVYSGISYPTGTIIGGLECHADGKWKPVKK